MNNIKQAEKSGVETSNPGSSPGPQNDQQQLPSTQTSNVDAQKPNPSVKPPSYQVLTESYDPSKIRRKTIVVRDDVEEFGKKSE